jgi:hypothetical protein
MNEGNAAPVQCGQETQWQRGLSLVYSEEAITSIATTTNKGSKDGVRSYGRLTHKQF